MCGHDKHREGERKCHMVQRMEPSLPVRAMRGDDVRGAPTGSRERKGVPGRGAGLGRGKEMAKDRSH